MALSMDEQRVLAEIERRLAAEDPGLATCLTAFRRPGPATVLRSPRARIIGSLFTVLLVGLVSLMVYAMIPFRAHGQRLPSATSSPATIAASHSASGGNGTPAQSMAATSTKAASKPSASSSASATGTVQGSNTKAGGDSTSSASGSG